MMTTSTSTSTTKTMTSSQSSPLLMQSSLSSSSFNSLPPAPVTAASSPSLSRRNVLSTAAASFPSLLAVDWLLSSTKRANAQPQSSSRLRPLSPAAAQAVAAAFSREGGKSKAPVLLRLAFHDAACFDVTDKDGGANGSIRFELDRPESFGLKRGWRVVEAVASRLKSDKSDDEEVSSLSFADLIALGGAWAVEATGGPKLLSLVPVGRADASQADPPGRLPSENADAAQLVASFARKGLSVVDLVALSGAHTLGSKGFGDPVTFDNEYYKTLLDAPWAKPGADEMASHIGLPSDHALPLDGECRKVIERFAGDQGAFFEAFTTSYVKMVGLGV